MLFGMRYAIRIVTETKRLSPERDKMFASETKKNLRAGTGAGANFVSG